MCRCSIPVVIMGETGCGKTRLIRYMSELTRQELDVRNMYIMKVSLNSVLSTNYENVEHFATSRFMEGLQTLMWRNLCVL